MQPFTPPIRRLTLIVAMAIGALAMVSACTRDLESARWARGEAVGRLVAELLQQKDSVQTINLAELAPFRWDRLYIFAPYTSASAVEEALGKPWSGAERSDIAQVDTAALLVFVAGDDIVAATMHPREYGDFVPVAGLAARSQTQALFRVERPASGGWLMRSP